MHSASSSTCSAGISACTRSYCSATAVLSMPSRLASRRRCSTRASPRRAWVPQPAAWLAARPARRAVRHSSTSTSTRTWTRVSPSRPRACLPTSPLLQWAATWSPTSRPRRCPPWAPPSRSRSTWRATYVVYVWRAILASMSCCSPICCRRRGSLSPSCLPPPRPPSTPPLPPPSLGASPTPTAPHLASSGAEAHRGKRQHGRRNLPRHHTLRRCHILHERHG
mmetsp:Transcript_27288/g.58783  ORF Transcript_27288/g.58783 Transcript_27288/m.58783 type:complete len:223 (+) Transcript_27288:369-1037(+)